MKNELTFDTFFPDRVNVHDRATFLEDITAEYPYFAVAPYLLLKDFKKDDTLLQQKTAVHFHPLRLHYLVHNQTLAVQEAKLSQTDNEDLAEIHTPNEWANVFDETEKNNNNEEIQTKHEVLHTEEVNVDKADEISKSKVDEPEELSEQTSFVSSQSDEPGEPVDVMISPNDVNSDHRTSSPETLISPVLVENKEDMLFEPLHTSDYFASQGIKLTDERLPQDRLGKQLKSFTEWLQTMKSLQTPVRESGVSPAVEATVKTLAEKSNTEGEVITESMAEAYIAQGKHGKAIEIYEKLKLINPAKSISFAAEISRLKA